MGTDKASVKLGNDTLLDFQLAQIPSGVPTIVVGEAMAARPEVMFTREDPPGSGPVAAVSAVRSLAASLRLVSRTQSNTAPQAAETPRSPSIASAKRVTSGESAVGSAAWPSA